MKFTLLAFLIAPLIPAFILSLFYPLSGSLSSTDLLSFALGAAFFYMFTFFFTAVIALPAFWALRRLSLVRWWSAVACGLVTGALAVTYLFKAPEARDYLLGTSLGGLGALVFWFMWQAGQHAAQQGAPADAAALRPRG